MRIQWFPGHMTKAFRMMQDQLRQVDCIIYVLDSRAVFFVLRLEKNPPRVYISAVQTHDERGAQCAFLQNCGTFWSISRF